MKESNADLAISSSAFLFSYSSFSTSGFAEVDRVLDFGEQADALAYSFSKGLNFCEANMWYANGMSSKILYDGFSRSNLKRGEIFICQAIYLKEGKCFEESIHEVDELLNIFGTDFIDTVQFSQSSFERSSFEVIAEYLHMLLDSNKVRYVSLTNANVNLLEKFYEEFKGKFFSHESVFSFETREAEDLGILSYADKYKIKNVVFQPLRRNKTALRNWPLLAELAKKYGKTQNQIILNWIIRKGYLPLFKSSNFSHIDENIDALSFDLLESDCFQIDSFRAPNYASPKITFKLDGDGIRIDQLPNVFDEIYDKKI